MSSTGHYVFIPEDWEHEDSDTSVGIMSDGMTHLPCLDRENTGTADLTSCSMLRKTSGGYAVFSEDWTCRDCGSIYTFLSDEYVGWDQPESD